MTDTDPTAPKGRPTPKRSDARAKRGGQSAPAPKTRREALARQREGRREEAKQVREGMRSGDVSKLPPRERAPERILARDFVDGRRNGGVLFLPAALILFVGNLLSKKPVVANALVSIWLFLTLLVIADSLVIYRSLKRLLRERYPNSTAKPRSVCLYAISRATLPRRFRLPVPGVRRGDPPR